MLLRIAAQDAALLVLPSFEFEVQVAAAVGCKLLRCRGRNFLHSRSVASGWLACLWRGSRTSLTELFFTCGDVVKVERFLKDRSLMEKAWICNAKSCSNDRTHPLR